MNDTMDKDTVKVNKYFVASANGTVKICSILDTSQINVPQITITPPDMYYRCPNAQMITTAMGPPRYPCKCFNKECQNKHDNQVQKVNVNDSQEAKQEENKKENSEEKQEEKPKENKAENQNETKNKTGKKTESKTAIKTGNDNANKTVTENPPQDKKEEAKQNLTISDFRIILDAQEDKVIVYDDGKPFNIPIKVCGKYVVRDTPEYLNVRLQKNYA